MKITVNVTQEDIKHGKRKLCTSCPIALAIRRLRKFKGSIVSRKEITSVFKGKWVIATPPKSAIEFINQFDAGQHVEPFTFELEFELCQ